MKKSIIKVGKLSPVFLLLFALISVFVCVLPVHADPIMLYLDPLAAVVGDTVAATGFGATADGEVRLYIGSLMLTSTIADGAGNYSARFVVPPFRAGSQIIIALDVESGDTAIAFLTVEPRVLVTPTVGSFNDMISVRGEGFAASQHVTLWLEAMNVTPSSAPTTSFLGTFETSFQVPSLPNGPHIFRAQDEDGNTAKTLMTVASKILAQPTSGAANTFVLVSGYGFSVSAQLTLFFDSIDVTPYGPVLASLDGSFVMAFFVPDVSSGIHSISAFDSMGNAARSPFVVPSPIMRLTPSTVFESSMIGVEGIGFQPGAPVVLYMEDVAATSIYDLVARTENIVPKTDGSFQYSFMVPITGAGVYEVTAYQMVGPSPSDLVEVASAGLTIMKRVSLDADVTASTMYFRGETAEFYLKTALDGELVDVQIDRALVYSANVSSGQDLASDATHISTGFYRMPYAIPDNASFGTYALLVEISLHSGLLEAFGSATGSFTISPFFTAQAAQILDIQNSIATVITPDLGTVKANLSAINAKLGSIEGKIAIIRSDVGTLQTSVGVINATLVSIEGRVATVQSDLGALKMSVDAINATLVGVDGDMATVKSELGTIRTSTDAINAKVTSIDDGVATVSSDLGTVKIRLSESDSQMNAATLFAVAAAVAASASAVVLYARKPPKPPTMPSASPPEEKPPAPSAAASIQPEKQEQAQTRAQTETREEASKPVESPPKEAPQPAEPPPQTTQTEKSEEAPKPAEPAPQPTQTETREESPKPAEPPPQTNQTETSEEAPKPEEPAPQTQPPPDSNTPDDSPPQAQPEPQAEPQTIVVQPDQPVPE